MKAVTAEQMRSIEQASVNAGVSLDALMENAGLQIADAITRRLWPIFGKRVVVLIGPGNNGSDGFVAARHLANRGARVSCVLLTKRPGDDPKRGLAEEARARVIDARSDSGAPEYRRLLESADLVLDAVLGTGRARPIDDTLGELLELAAACPAPVHALDLPTGLDATTGRMDPRGLAAGITYMLGLPKLGALTAAGDGRLGAIEVLDIGIPDGLDVDIKTEYLDQALASSLITNRPLDANKGTFGRALIFAGSPNYLGAAVLAVRSATRSGAGLVGLATRRSVYELAAGQVPDAIYHPLPQDNDGFVDPAEGTRELATAAESATAILLGPGLGRDSQTESLVRSFISVDRSDQPAVLDADCLNILSGTANWWDKAGGPKVITPHPGEMGRLLGTSAREVQDGRLTAAQTAAERFGAVTVLKGAATIIASPDRRARVSPWVNPGLAKGGTGDVLAGLLVGLLAQAPANPYDAASLAVYLHGLAGQVARDRLGATSMTASDVVDAIPEAFQLLGAA